MHNFGVLGMKKAPKFELFQKFKTKIRILLFEQDPDVKDKVNFIMSGRIRIQLSRVDPAPIFLTPPGSKVMRLIASDRLTDLLTYLQTYKLVYSAAFCS